MYYETMRWPGWVEEVRAIGGDQVFGIEPVLSLNGPPIGERGRKPIGVAEVYDLYLGRRADESHI